VRQRTESRACEDDTSAREEPRLEGIEKPRYEQRYQTADHAEGRQNRMQNLKTHRVLSALAVTVLAALANRCAEADDYSWYAGVNVGETRSTIDGSRTLNGDSQGAYFPSGIVRHDRDNGYKVFFGYKFDRYLAVESGYFDLGKFGFTMDNAPSGTVNGNTQVRGLDLDVIGTLPFTKRLSGFARAGYSYAQTNASLMTTASVSGPDSSRQRSMNYKFGLGFQYVFTKTLGLRLEAERYRINDGVGGRADVDLISLGLVLQFGESKWKTYSAQSVVSPVGVVAPVLAVAVEPEQ
jgi:OOP family OmpA-OmpF porin